jgi:hypothetical protein
VLFGVTIAIALAPLLVPRRRRKLSVRADLAVWLDEVTAVTGETVDDVVDRALSSYRAAASGR